MDIAKRITSPEMTFYNLYILLTNGFRSANLDDQPFVIIRLLSRFNFFCFSQYVDVLYVLIYLL